VLTNPLIVLTSPDNDVIYATPLPTLTIPSDGGTVQIPHSIAFPEYDPGRRYNLVLEADMDGDGQYEPLASVRALNVLPETDTLSIRQDPSGDVIIVWPNPCAVLEMNDNLGNQAGWTSAPVQTSPYRIRPTSNDMKFFRLRR
jgi:hypothetical protein